MRTIYYHGVIVTMEKENDYQEALVVCDGRIQAVGSDEEILNMKQEGDKLIDLEGKVVFPGFIDGHSHFVGVANSLTQCDLSEAISFDEIISKMKHFIEENNIPPGQWVCGNAYDHNFLIEKAHPTKEVLDCISTEHPIVLIHASSHMGSVNSLALEKMHIDANTPDPKGGKYYRLEGSMEPNGHMEENAFIAFQNAMPMPSIEELMRLIIKAQDIYASYGITTVQEGMVAKPLFELLQYAASNNLLHLDIVGYIDLNNCRNLLNEHRNLTKHYWNHFKIGGYKIFLDGSPQGRTAWMKTPYKGSEDNYCGYPVLSDEKLYKLIEESLEDEVQLLAHCNGDAAAEQYISQFENVLQKYPDKDTRRPVMIHAQLVDRSQLERMPALSMAPSFFIAHTYFWGDVHIENFGLERASMISPAHTAEKLHLPYTFHQDSPVLQPDMMRTIWCAVNRKTRKGISIGKEEAVSVWEAMKAITINGAYQYFEEHEKGTISVGKIADLVILNNNPLCMNHNEIKDVLVLETIKDGKTIYRRK